MQINLEPVSDDIRFGKQIGEQETLKQGGSDVYLMFTFFSALAVIIGYNLAIAQKRYPTTPCNKRPD